MGGFLSVATVGRIWYRLVNAGWSYPPYGMIEAMTACVCDAVAFWEMAVGKYADVGGPCLFVKV